MTKARGEGLSGLSPGWDPWSALRRRTGLRGLALAAAVVVGGGCTLEERPDSGDENAAQESRAQSDGEPSPSVAEATARDSVRTVSEAFRESLEMGDLSSALQLLDGDARVIDRVGGDPPPGASTGEVLLRAIRLRQDGLALEEVDSRLTVHGDVAVQVIRSEASWDGDEERAGAEGSVQETAVFVRTDEGWRVGHLHRSIDPGGG